MWLSRELFLPGCAAEQRKAWGSQARVSTRRTNRELAGQRLREELEEKKAAMSNRRHKRSVEGLKSGYFSGIDRGPARNSFFFFPAACVRGGGQRVRRPRLRRHSEAEAA